MNRQDLRDRLKLRLGLPASGDGLLDVDALHECIRLALADVCEVNDWPWLVTSATVVLTTGTGAFPAGCVKVRELVVNGDRARPVGLAGYLDAVSDGTSRCWTAETGVVLVTPVPSAALSGVLWFVQQEPALTVDTQSPLLPDVHQQALLARASYHANVRRGRKDDALRDDAEFQAGLVRMRDAGQYRTGAKRVALSRSQRWASW